MDRFMRVQNQIKNLNFDNIFRRLGEIDMYLH